VCYAVPLLEGVPELVVNGLDAGLYGSSFRFVVRAEDMNRSAKRSDHNPQGLAERTIRDAQLFEFGPVTYPAYLGATAGLRSWTAARRARALLLARLRAA
jgi:phage head maturation protease